jgi:ABC-type multidrug transport system ATPase subunit
MAYALEIDGLTKRFGDKTVVDDISFSVGEGEVFGFLGPNGSGKTTTIRIVLDILKPDAGVIRLLGGLTAGRRCRGSAISRKSADCSEKKGFEYPAVSRAAPRTFQI